MTSSFNLLFAPVPVKTDFQNFSAHITYFGKHYKATFIQGQRNKGALTSDGVVFTLSKMDAENFNKYFKLWHKRLAKNIFEMYVNDWHKTITTLGYNIVKPKVKIERMLQDWGLCFYNQKIIILNEYLLAAPQECISYIILHEMVHLLEETHNTIFNSLLTHIDPQWQVKANSLKSFTAKHQITPAPKF